MLWLRGAETPTKQTPDKGRTRCGAERERGERRLRSRVKQGFAQASLVMIIRARDDLSVQPFQTPIFFPSSFFFFSVLLPGKAKSSLVLSCLELFFFLPFLSYPLRWGGRLLLHRGLKKFSDRIVLMKKKRKADFVLSPLKTRGGGGVGES